MPCRIMWLLVLFCISAVGAVAISPIYNVTSLGSAGDLLFLNDTWNETRAAADYVISSNDTHNATSSAPVGAISFHDAHNVSSSASADFLNGSLNATSLPSGTAAAELYSSENKTAETLAEFAQDMPIQEGDILIELQEDRNAVQTLWPDATLPYVITNELAYREAEIKAAFKMISDATCIRFTERDSELNYVKFVDGKGCASFVGCRGGEQQLFISPECNVGNLCHEVIHALGLYHEHTREDRDEYVTINWQNIQPGKESNFKVKHGNTLKMPYDLQSIMHYGTIFFSANKEPTILPRQGGVTIGQRTHLSQLDIQRLNKLYHCDERMASIG